MININCQYIYQGAGCKNDKVKHGVCIEYGNKTCEFKKPWPKPKPPPPPPPKR